MYCNNCGASLPDGSKFCNSCGTAFGGAAAPQRKRERWETTVEQAHPDHENRLIKLYEAFGWELLQRQEIYVKDSHIEGKFDGNYSVTETTNYVKLTFRRDQNMPNYRKLVELENECSAALNGYPDKPSKFLLYLGLVVIVIYGLGVIAIVFYFIKMAKYKKAYKEHDAFADEVIERTTAEADHLLSE